MLCFDGRFEIKEEDGKQTLVIKDLKLDDAADFTCKIGDRETSAKLQVDEGLRRIEMHMFFSLKLLFA